jgi:3-methylcrotonyl-CoA carboxylase alpha subunit
MIRRLLVANRGEIAVRVIRACRELGIAPVVIFSEPDRNALHVQLADEAVCVGPASPPASYLNQDAILAAARRTGAESVHPGYGFLAENADFAVRCREEGLVFVGPSAEAIRLMGDKGEAKRLARAAGVPVVPGYDGEEQSDEHLQEEAKRIGYPVLIKAAAGGGGKGMHATSGPDELGARLAQARREALLAFGDDRVLLERLLIRPRHIEVQVLGDEHGTLVALGERECSIQRRHQKVIEEAPSTAVSPGLRSQLCELALTIARAAGYSNAGTVEFLLDRDGNVYFLEMNTRLQVEHSVTEATYGVDLVRLQLDIASGGRLELRQGDLTPRGHAIECRVYAEDPSSGYLPSTGSVLAFRLPEGPGIRNDAGTYAGDTISPYYDPLLAKLTAFAPDRLGAVRRMRAALRDCAVLGLRTNLALLANVLADSEFERGDIDIDFLDRKPELAQETASPPPSVLFAAAAAEILGVAPKLAGTTGWRAAGPWRVGGQGLMYSWTCGGQMHAVHADRMAGDDGWRLRSEGGEFAGQIESPSPGVVLLREGASVTRFVVAHEGQHIWLGHDGLAWRLVQPSPPSLARSAGGREGGGNSLVAPMPGRVARVEVREGEAVSAHQVLVVMEAMKMEHAIDTPSAGVVRRLYCEPGDLVAAGALLVEIGDIEPA